MAHFHDQPELRQDGIAIDIPESEALGAAPRGGRLNINTTTPVNHNGCFDFDRVIKSGYVEKRTSKTKVRPCSVTLRLQTLTPM